MDRVMKQNDRMSLSQISLIFVIKKTISLTLIGIDACFNCAPLKSLFCCSFTNNG